VNVFAVASQEVRIDVPWEPCDVLEAFIAWGVEGGDEPWNLGGLSLVSKADGVLDLRVLLPHVFVDDA